MSQVQSRAAFFDYVEAVLDDEDLDTIETLQSFPTMGRRLGYGAIARNQNNSTESEVALTVLGMSHSSALREYVPVFFELRLRGEARDQLVFLLRLAAARVARHLERALGGCANSAGRVYAPHTARGAPGSKLG